MILPRARPPSQAKIELCRAYGFDAPGTWQPQERPKRGGSYKDPTVVRKWLAPDLTDAYAQIVFGPEAGRHVEQRLGYDIKLGIRDRYGISYEKTGVRWHMARGYRRDLERGIVGDIQLSITPARTVRSFCLRGTSIDSLELGLQALGLDRHRATLHGEANGALWAWVALRVPVLSDLLGRGLRARIRAANAAGVVVWPDGDASVVLPCSRESDWLDWETGRPIYLRRWRGEPRVDRRRQLATWVEDAGPRLVDASDFSNDVGRLDVCNQGNNRVGDLQPIDPTGSARVWALGVDEGCRHAQLIRLVPWLMGRDPEVGAAQVGDLVEAWWRRTRGGSSKLVGEVGWERSCRMVRRAAEKWAAKLSRSGTVIRSATGCVRERGKLGRREEAEIIGRIERMGYGELSDEILEAVRWLMPRGRVGTPVRVHHTHWVAWAGRYGRQRYQELRDGVMAVLGGGKTAGGYVVGVRSQAWVWPPLSRTKKARPGLVTSRAIGTATWDLVVFDGDDGPRANWMVRSTGPPWAVGEIEVQACWEHFTGAPWRAETQEESYAN